MLPGVLPRDPLSVSGVVAHWALSELVSKDLGGGAAPTFEDDVGGFDLQAASGTAQVTQLAPGLFGANLDQTVHLATYAAEAALQLTGDMAFALFVVPHWIADEATHTLVRCGGLSTETAIDRNALWGLRFDGNGFTPTVFHDTAAGAAVSFSDTGFALSQGLLHRVWVSRVSNVYRIYVNGRLTVSSPSGTLTAPGGGALAKLRLGGLTPGVTGTAFRGAVADLMLIDGTTDATDVDTDYAETMVPFPRAVP